MNENKYDFLKSLISGRIEEQDLSYERASALCGLSKTVIGKILKGQTRHPANETIAKLARGLGFSEADYRYLIDPLSGKPDAKSGARTNTGSHDLGPAREVPIISWVEAGQWSSAVDDFPVDMADDYVYTDTKGSNLFALRVVGSSMEPRFHEGDIIIVNPNIEPRSGDFAVAKLLDTEEVIFKKYILREEEGQVILKPLNPEFDEIHLGRDERFSIIGRVVEKKEIF